MSAQSALHQRLQFLARVVRKEMRHLITTDGRLFLDTFTPEKAESLESAPDLAERVDAFVSRFGRLQDTLADNNDSRHAICAGREACRHA